MPAELDDLWLNHHAAIALIRISLVIPLMIILSRVESVEFRQLSHNRLVPDFLLCDFSHDLFRDGFLLRRVIEDCGAILSADIGALTIQSRWIVDRKEDFEQFLVS